MASTSRPVFNGFNSNMIQVALISGGTTGDELTVTNITVNDPILMCLELAETSNNPTLRTATFSSAGKVSTSVDTSGDNLLILWLDVSAAETG